jgi:hypothetical protein
MANYDIMIPTGSNFTKNFQIKTSDGVILNLGGYTAAMKIIQNPGNFSTVTFTSAGGQLILDSAKGIITLALTPAEVATINGNFYKLEVTTGAIVTEVLTGSLFILDETKVGVDYLIPYLRLRIGDTNPETYRYADAWLHNAMIMGLKYLDRWWDGRYKVNDFGIVSRNDWIWYDTTIDKEGVIEKRDEPLIVLMAAIVILEGSLENSAWSTASWKDAEISFSNIEGGRVRDSHVKRLWDELNSYLLPPTKRLARARKNSLPGFANNDYETFTKF